MRASPLFAALACATLVSAAGELHAAQEPYRPFVAPASGEGEAALAGFEVPDGFVTELVAAEPWLANPVCLWVDGSGSIYVAETFRHHEGVTDIRDEFHLMEQDLANRTVEDRVEMLRRDAGAAFEATYAVAHERVRLLRDSDGDGTLDQTVVFADGFDDPAAGIGAGLLAHGGEVYYTCIPDLWRLCDTDGDGRADEREVLSTGYGVNIAMLGHDLHGLRIGPDGRLYFSCGDRGFHVETPDGVLDHSHAGAVLRCELDGSDLEVYATGLRNPQELVFDAHGNLFTGDNNSDGGDRARWVQVLEGGDSGWRYGYQWITEPVLRGPWNDERLWHPAHPGQAAYLVPPIANLGAGPSGLTIHPGTGFPDEYAGHFFLCDFRGEAGISGIHAFDLVPRGAGFELGEVTRFVWGSLVTDADFGPDGALYFSDWVAGWEKTGKGRVYRTSHPAAAAAPEVARVRELLGRGFGGESSAELERLLGHADQRVRQGAQLELAGRGREGRAVLERAATGASSLLARLHGIWGLWIAARRDAAAAATLAPLLGDAEPEVRAQAARVLGDVRADGIGPRLAALLADDSARVRYTAALALGKVRWEPAQGALVQALAAAGEDDRVLRHGLIAGLAGCARPQSLAELVAHDSVDVRVAAAVALRRQASELVARYLDDADPRVVREAARALHDVPIEGAAEELARRLGAPAFEGNALVRRALNANFRLGTRAHAERVARFAADRSCDEGHRAEALDMLRLWARPPGRDWVMGEWRPLGEREADFAAACVRELVAPESLGGASADLVRTWIAVVRDLGVEDHAPLLAAWARDAARPAAVRSAALAALEAWEWPELGRLLRELLGDADGTLRAAALAGLERVAPAELADVAERVLGTGETSELRAAYRALGRAGGARATELLAAELERLDADLVPGEVALDLVLAAEESGAAALARRLEARAARRSADPLLAPYLDSLLGGDPRRGRDVFVRADVSCVRCHRVESQTGTEVGPDLRGVGERLTRLQLVETVVAPNRRRTPGYENWIFQLADDRVVSGRIVAEDEHTLRLQSSDGQTFELERDDVVLRKETLSAMPENLAASLSREDVRDLVAYLVCL